MAIDGFLVLSWGGFFPNSSLPIALLKVTQIAFALLINLHTPEHKDKYVSRRLYAG